MLGFGVLETADLVGTCQPFELVGRDNDVSGMCAAGKLAATRAVAILEYVFRPVKLVADSATKTAALEGFAHAVFPVMIDFELAAV